MRYRYKEQIYYPGRYCFPDNGEEWFWLSIFGYSISQIWKDIEVNPKLFLCGKALVKDCSRYGKDNLNPEYVKQADLNKPLILVEIAPDRYEVMDGFYCIAKALQQGMDYLPAYYLTSEQAAAYLDSEENYARYLDYWNRKVEDNDLSPYYAGTLCPEQSLWKDRILDVTVIQKRIESCLVKYQRIEIYDEGQWFSLFRLRERIFVGESDAHDQSVRCATPAAVDLNLIEKALPYFEGWMMKDKKAKEAARKIKNVRYIMALIRLFSYHDWSSD